MRPWPGSGLPPGSLSLLWLPCTHLNTEGESGSSLCAHLSPAEQSPAQWSTRGLASFSCSCMCSLSLEKAVPFSVSSTFLLSREKTVLCDSFLATSWWQEAGKGEQTEPTATMTNLAGWSRGRAETLEERGWLRRLSGSVELARA